MSPDQLTRAEALRAAGQSYHDIAAAVGGNRHTLARKLRHIPTTARTARGQPRQAARRREVVNVLPEDVVAAILDRCADWFGVSHAMLLSTRREYGYISGARQELEVALHRAGASCAEVARLIGRDHSSVDHAVRCVRRDPVRSARVDLLVGSNPALLLPWLAKLLPDLSPYDRRALEAYCRVNFLRQRDTSTWPAYGLALLRRADYRAALERALAAVGMGDEGARVGMQLAACYGIRGAA